MSEIIETKIIARIYNEFSTKFAVPRQSGLAKEMSYIVFEKQYRDENALRGIEGYSHLWLLWHFSQNTCTKWSPTVRPPRLGGNVRMGVFATRSPNRPSPIGLSSVELVAVEKSREYGTVLKVRGADLMNNTPIIDIKPYLSFTDSHPEAKNGFAGEKLNYRLNVEIPASLKQSLSYDKADLLSELLSEDPRPSYIEDEKRVYGFDFGEFEVKFTVSGNTLTVCSITKNNSLAKRNEK